MRFCATMRSPAFSIIALMAPVTLRAVASGLIIENVRSVVIDSSFEKVKRWGLQKRRYRAGLITVTHHPGKRTASGAHIWAGADLRDEPDAVKRIQKSGLIAL